MLKTLFEKIFESQLKELHGQIDRLTKRVEFLEHKDQTALKFTQIGPTVLPYQPLTASSPFRWCQYCGRYNCTEIHVICGTNSTSLTKVES